MDYIELIVADIKNSNIPSEAFVLLLKETEGIRILPIIIGTSEAKSMIMIFNKIKSKRPSTHELFSQFILTADYILKETIIYRYDEGIYYSYLVFLHDDQEVKLDSRTSDAISLALLFDAPIKIVPSVMEQAIFNDIEYVHTDYFNLDTEENEINDCNQYIESQIHSMTDKELSDMLEGAIESEDFELAIKIQEEQQRRNG